MRYIDFTQALNAVVVGSLLLYSGCKPATGINDPHNPPGQFSFNFSIDQHGQCKLHEQWIKNSSGNLGIVTEGTDILDEDRILPIDKCRPLFEYAETIAKRSEVKDSDASPTDTKFTYGGLGTAKLQSSTCFVTFELLYDKQKEESLRHTFYFSTAFSDFSVITWHRSVKIPVSAQELSSFVEKFTLNAGIPLAQLCNIPTEPKQ